MSVTTIATSSSSSSSSTPKRMKKIVICGDGNVGKTYFVSKLTRKHFADEYEPTIGCEVTRTDKYEFLDTAGVEKFGGLRDGYYIGADFGIIFCDATNLESIRNIQNWHRDLQRVLEYNVPIIVCVNKIDLLSTKDSICLKKRFIFKKYHTKFISVKKDNLQNVIEFLTSYEVQKSVVEKTNRAIRFIEDVELLKKLTDDIPNIKKWMTFEQISPVKN